MITRRAPMKRTGFKKKAYPWNREPKERKPYRWPKGKKTNEWQAIWREEKVKLEAAGITSCELRGEGCKGNTFLTPAHPLKRRNCTPANLAEIAILCVVCHAAVEILPEAQMAVIVRGIIASRK